MAPVVHVLHSFRRALWRTVVHDGFGVAKAAAYSSILTFFPALMVVTHILTRSWRSEAILREVQYALGRIFPEQTTAALGFYFGGAHRQHSNLFLITTSVLTLWSSLGIMFSWMDGFRRAYQLPRVWGMWKEYGIAILMVFLALVPMVFATLLVVLGKNIESWMVARSQENITFLLLVVFAAARWLLAIATSIAVLSLLYHFAVPRTQPWKSVLPGAVLATALWFLATAVFGLYLQYWANYRVLYGSLATAIVLLVWLYIVSVVVLVGAEFNALLFPRIVPGDAIPPPLTATVAPQVSVTNYGEDPETKRP